MLLEQSHYSCLFSHFWLELFYILKEDDAPASVLLNNEWKQKQDGFGFFPIPSNNPGFTLKPEDVKDPH